LAAAGSSLEKIVKVTVFLRDIADFARMNEVYTRFFTSNPPARTCVAVKDIPGNFPLEIEVIASK
jgi:2-iminobutanoate/2-iminopropanoate deaminase